MDPYLGQYPRPFRIACWEGDDNGSTDRLLPTGECGCGSDTAIGSFFPPGHDKTAESAVISVEFGGVPEFLDRHGNGLGGKNTREEVAEWQERLSQR